VSEVATLRILVVHNRYSSRVPSGENLAVEDEVRWLRDAGVEVETFEASNDEVLGAGAVARARQALESVWSPSAHRSLADMLGRTRPDLVHVHNLFPLLTASAPAAAHRRGLPIVWTVHNHRVTCVAGTNFRDGQPCHRCRPGARTAGVRYGCYGDSRLASALVTASTGVFRRFARGNVTALAISAQLRQWLIDSAGFDPAAVRVKYNAVAPPPEAVDLRPPATSQDLLFAGHLIDHKGIGLLLEAWRRARPRAGTTLTIAGDGPLVADVRAAAAADPQVRWVGHLDGKEMASRLAEARAVVVPSTWDEPFGRTAAEGLAYGRPVITTGTGGLAEIVDEATGWRTGVDAGALAAALTAASQDDRAVEDRGRAAERRYRSQFSPAATTDALLAVYEELIGGRARGGRPSVR
jgi:glycosyltransferase involved in cell wall biosynthesis